jgi:isopentenyl phosphate kinase
VYLKLGGALLTRKRRPETPRPHVLQRLAGEIAAWAAIDDRPLVLAHGSGSYAHVAARETQFLEHPDVPLSLARVAAAARRLNVLVVDALIAAGLPALPLPGSLLAECRDGTVADVHAELVAAALRSGLLPVLYGDAAPDATRGGTIASTEPLLFALAMHMPPQRVVLATDVDGIYRNDPHVEPNQAPMERVTADDNSELGAQLGTRPGAVDVTGGMASKVRLMQRLVRSVPDTEVRVLSGLRAGAVRAALAGDPCAGGTLIVASAD